MKKQKTPELLTNESIRGHFDDNFKMAGYIMQIARNYQEAGKEFTLNSLMSDIRKSVGKYQEL